MTALNKTELKPVISSRVEVSQSFFTYLLWNSSYLFKQSTPSWSGYMSSISQNEILSTSIVTMLPVIDMPATDTTSLYSLLCFIEDQSSKLTIPTPPAVTCDQSLFVKAYEIVSFMKMNIIIRLGGFYQLMSFLGSIGYMMDGSGLRNAPESVYASITVGHMMTGKAYARALRGHFLASALLSIILEEFWFQLSEVEKGKLLEIYDLNDPSSKDDKLAEKLVKWFKEKSEILKLSSRTSALWLSYIEYVYIVQEFIKAERTHDWLAHIDTTKKMLNLHAATGHYDYSKAGRLYLQSMGEMQQKHPFIFEQF